MSTCPGVPWKIPACRGLTVEDPPWWDKIKAMKRTVLFVLALMLLAGVPSFGSSLGTATRAVIPSEVQQIINVDYRRMKNSDTAMAIEAKLMPPDMKQFQDAL